jgi:hypothetical protein
LAGAAAWAFARRHGHAPAPPGTLVTARALARWPPPGQVASVGNALSAPWPSTRSRAAGGGDVDRRRLGKRPGGSATALPCSLGRPRARGVATGPGRRSSTLTRRLALAVEAGAAPAAAAAALLDEMIATGGVAAGAGVIAVDRAGRIAATHRTPTMAFAAVRADGRGAQAAAGISTNAAPLEAQLQRLDPLT